MARNSQRTSARPQVDQQRSIPPEREVAGGPDSPLELGAAGWRNTLKRTGSGAGRKPLELAAAA
jgi:hypothetical protein